MMDAKVFYSVQAAIVFLVVSSPMLYKLVQAVFGRLFTVASKDGCPTVAGLLLHTVVFGLVMYGLMVLQKPKEAPVVVTVVAEEKKTM